jgi:HAD superfamily hydrolase (TIGR01509 family)
MQSQIPLLIFDLDGVLVDSEKISERLYVKCLQLDGFEVDTAFYNQHFLGRSSRDCMVTLQDHFGRLPSEEALAQYDEKIVDALRTELEPVSFVKDALMQLPQPKCVASGSELHRIRISLETTGLAHFFQNITSSYEVAVGKPAPDVFLKAAEKNNYAPENCLVIEDTIFGVEAGLAADMRVLCYQPDEALAYAVPEGVVVFESMKQLPVLIDEIVKKIR